jgi:hypothetical protein
LVGGDGRLTVRRDGRGATVATGGRWVGVERRHASRKEEEGKSRWRKMSEGGHGRRRPDSRKLSACVEEDWPRGKKEVVCRVLVLVSMPS